MIIEWGQGLLKQAKQVTTTFVEELGKELKDVDNVLKEMINDGDSSRNDSIKDPVNSESKQDQQATEHALKCKQQPQLCQDDWE